MQLGAARRSNADGAEAALVGTGVLAAACAKFFAAARAAAAVITSRLPCTVVQVCAKRHEEGPVGNSSAGQNGTEGR